jgi:carboxynorspermidine decarboxylase
VLNEPDPSSACETGAACQTPFFLYDLEALAANLRTVRRWTDAAGARLMYAVKACAYQPVLEMIAPQTSGFSCSSPFEARLARKISPHCEIHYTTPCIRPSDVASLDETVTTLHANSLGQWDQLRSRGWSDKLAIRINPQLSLVDDPRYDPCAVHSKLGIGLGELSERFEQDAVFRDALNGISLHTNCDSRQFEPLAQTISRLEETISPILHRIETINLGGGYHFDEPDSQAVFKQIVGRLIERYGLTVYIEPGSGIVNSSGSLVASVVDVFVRDGQQIAVLDTTVNHLPEVLEFDYSPDVLGDGSDGQHEVILAGASCLAGDVFGQYGFDRPVQLGQRIVFPSVGAYSCVKMHRFNGINLPSIVVREPQGKTTVKKEYTFEEFLLTL